MSETNINAALVAAYLESGLMPRASTAFEGVDFTPPAGQSWARITGLPSDRYPAALGTDAPQEWTGVFQIDLFHPKDTGTGPILADADKALAFFRSGKRLNYQKQGVLIRKSSRSPLRDDDIWQVVSISVYCTAWVFPA